MLGYWVAFFAALAETLLGIGLLLPGSTLLLLLGALSANGYLNFDTLLWAAIAGAVIGDNVNYWLGQRYGRQWAQRGVWFLKPGHFEQAHAFFNRHGAKSVFLGRFIPSVKEITPFVAGTAGMHYRTFLLWNVLGAAGWGLQWVGVGYLFGQSLNLAQTWMSRAGMALLILVVVIGLLWFVQRFIVRRGRDIWMVAVSLGRSVSRALGRNPYVRVWKRRHPHSGRFLAARLDRSHFYGLPLTILVIAFIYVLALFAGIVTDILNSTPIVAVDQATAQLVRAFRDPDLVAPLVWITNLAATPLVIALLAAACVVLWMLNRTYAAAGLLTSTVGAAIFLTLGKLAVQRPRQLEGLVFETSYSFPSGHATHSIAFYGFLAYLLIRASSRLQVRIRLFFVAAGLALLIGLSRILLGAHYLSDVWAGYLVGTLWLIAGISLTEWLTAIGRLRWGASPAPGRKKMAAGLVALAVVGAMTFSFMHPPVLRTAPEQVIVQLDRPLAVVLKEQDLTRTTTFLGAPEQPLTFAIVTPDEETMTATLARAGWTPADRPGLGNMMRMAREGLDYGTAPVSPAFWDRRINDLAWERHVQGEQGSRLVTIRIWRTGLRQGANQVFVGVARAYTGTRWVLTHTVSPDIDGAAKTFVESLAALDQPLERCQQDLAPPGIGTYLMGDQFFTRGQMWVLALGSAAQAAPLCQEGGASP